MFALQYSSSQKTKHLGFGYIETSVLSTSLNYFWQLTAFNVRRMA